MRYAFVLLCTTIWAVPFPPEAPFSFEFAEETYIPAPNDKFPVYFPDAELAIAVENDVDELMFWTDGVNMTFRTEGPDFTQQTPDPMWSVMNSSSDKNAVDVSGDWLNSVFRVKKGEPNLFAFVHGENHYFNGSVGPTGKGHREWNFAFYATSEDDGRTWKKQGLVTSDPKPFNLPAHNGGQSPDSFLRLRDGAGFMAFSPGVAMRTSDPLGRPGTWLRYFNGSWSYPGVLTNEEEVYYYYNKYCGFKNNWKDHVKCSRLPGLDDRNVAGPVTVTYNKYLDLYVMVFTRWGSTGWKRMYMKYSYDAINWDEQWIPMVWNQTEKNSSEHEYQWAQIVSRSTGESDRESWVLYGKTPRQHGRWGRDFFQRKITFQKKEGYSTVHEKLKHQKDVVWEMKKQLKL